MFDFDELEAIEATGVRTRLDERNELQDNCIATDFVVMDHMNIGESGRSQCKAIDNLEEAHLKLAQGCSGIQKNGSGGGDLATTKRIEANCSGCMEANTAIDQNSLCKDGKHALQSDGLETRGVDEGTWVPKCNSDDQVVEKVETLIDAGKLKSVARLILWPHMASKPGSLLKSPCRHVCVFGAHHTCTGAMMREIPRFFNVSIVNKHFNDNPRLWKHTVFQRQPLITDSTFCVCLVKDPAFWIQSLARDPVAGTFYDIFPVGATYDRLGHLKYVPVEQKDRNQLFRCVLFDSNIYRDAIAVWEGTVQSYFDEAIFPIERTAVVRCEDFLFNFDSVISALAHRGLPLRPDAPADRMPINDTAKDTSHPDVTRRNRHELLKYYRDPVNRFHNLSDAQKQRLNAIDKGIVGPLGYHEGCCGLLP